MLCVITLLKENAVRFITTKYDVVSKEEYKYCTNLIILIPFQFTINELLGLKHPMIIRYATTNAITKILYNSKNLLEVSTVLEKPKPINWKQQHQRHQTVKLLQITG